ncbi:MAG: hypothetical protein AAF497_26730, partial [Planctomycetota bacterium]
HNHNDDQLRISGQLRYARDKTTDGKADNRKVPRNGGQPKQQQPIQGTIFFEQNVDAVTIT